MDVAETTVAPASALTPAISALPPVEAERFDRAFARATGAALTEHNSVRLLLDARENFPAWLDAIRNAQRYVLFESYIIADDDIGRQFVDALAAKARDGVRVCVVYDWLGSTKWKAPWADLRAAGAEVHCFNPPSFASPLAWLARDHRKSIVVDGVVGFVSGLCVNDAWVGNRAKHLQPWRDTGVEIRGPALVDIGNAFLQVWNACGGAPLVLERPTTTVAAGNIRVRVIAGVPNAAGTYRTDLLVASLAKEHLWLTD
ncbi:MAG: cardiolipin synthase B, partial [Casimicrobiaceae bacterium]